MDIPLLWYDVLLPSTKHNIDAQFLLEGLNPENTDTDDYRLSYFLLSTLVIQEEIKMGLCF
jgi:hypothetical protein